MRVLARGKLDDVDQAFVVRKILRTNPGRFENADRAGGLLGDASAKMWIPVRIAPGLRAGRMRDQVVMERLRWTEAQTATVGKQTEFLPVAVTPGADGPDIVQISLIVTLEL